MPNFRFEDEQAGAITAFLMSVGGRTPRRTGGMSAGGNASRGRNLVETVGCKGCHVVGDDERMRKERGFSFDIAPELSMAGSKLDPEWIYAWLKNLRAYRPPTQMPNLRLSDQEARDIVAYIATLRDDRTFEPAAIDLASDEV